MKNKATYREQKRSIERLSPCPKQDFSKTDTGFFKDKKLKEIPHEDVEMIARDPIAKEVQLNR
jgi:hypothetical protein